MLTQAKRMKRTEGIAGQKGRGAASTAQALRLAAAVLALFLLTAAMVTAEASAAKAAASTSAAKQYPFPKGFVYLDEVLPKAQFEIRYYSDYNFVGARIDGYKAPYAIVTEEAAAALKKVNDSLAANGYTLRIYDAYRPTAAVAHFIRWSKTPGDTRMKADFYPALNKKNLFKLGFISSRSGHSRGSTVDLTLASLKTGKAADMGSPYDFFGEISYYNTTKVSAAQHANRKLLRDEMIRGGFEPYRKEWWHFTLKNEPYPSTYFNFEVK
ncbi:M15 family metallopeptidase [Paenibacillus spiritus]|nr:M15 family metallopeptidase [Paenibacillus spiritus]